MADMLAQFFLYIRFIEMQKQKMLLIQPSWPNKRGKKTKNNLLYIIFLGRKRKDLF